MRQVRSRLHLPQKGIDLAGVTDADPMYIADALPSTVVEAAYRKQELSYRTQDAHVHVIDMHETNGRVPDPEAMQSSDFEEIALRFLDDYDCNLSENRQWENVTQRIFALTVCHPDLCRSGVVMQHDSPNRPSDGRGKHIKQISADVPSADCFSEGM